MTEDTVDDDYPVDFISHHIVLTMCVSEAHFADVFFVGV